MGNLITKTQFDTDLKALENKIPDVNGFVRKTGYNTKISEIGNKIPSDLSGLVTFTKFNTKLKKVDDKTNSNSSKVISYDNKLNQANTRIDYTERNVFYFLTKDDLEGNYSIFESGYNYFKRIVDNTCNVTYAHYWQSKGLSNEKINAANTNTDNDLAPIVKFNGSQMYLEFKKAVLKENKATYSHGSVANIYIVYKLKPYVNANTGLTINDCLFGAIKLTKNSDPVKYKYEGYGICFDSIWTYSFGNEYAKNVIIFGANLKNSVHAINRANN